MIVIYLSLHSPYEYSVTKPRTTLSSPPPPQEGGKESLFEFVLNHML